MKTKILLSAFLLCTVWMSYGQWTYTNLTEAKSFMGSVALGNKAYFAGGGNGNNYFTTVEVYDVSTGTWGVAGNLSVARQITSGVTCGSKIFFAGGMNYSTNISYTNVDIFDTITQQWTLEQLSFARFTIAAVSHNNKVLFAGGVQSGTGINTDIVDIYDTQTGLWTIAYLSQPRSGIAAAVVGDLAIFAGGLINGGQYGGSNRVDIYNFTTNTWSTDSLSQARGYASAVTIGNKVIIAGGVTSVNHPTDRVDIYDASTGTWSTTALSIPKSAINNGVNVNGKAFFAGGGNFKGNGFNNPSSVVDIYDPVTGNWSVDSLMHPLVNHSVAGVGNKLVVAGGETSGGFYVSLVEIYTDLSLIHIPADFPTIQQGILAATPGDTVLVDPGIYYEQINFLGKKPLMVASRYLMDGDTSHIDNTIIDGSQITNPDSASVVYFISGEDTTSVINGFTIRHGRGTKYLFETGADFSRNTTRLGTSIRSGFSGEKRETYVDLAGGGIFISGSGAKIINNHITENHLNDTLSEEIQVLDGAGIATQIMESGEWIVIGQNVIDNNSNYATKHESYGVGMSICYNARVVENTVSNNINTGTMAHVLAGGIGIYQYPDWTQKTAIVEQNLVKNNLCESSGSWANSAGVFIQIANGNFTGNIVEQNVVTTVTTSGGGSGGLYIFYPADGFLVKNNVFKDNTSNLWAGGFSIENDLILENTVFIENNFFINNSAKYGAGFTTINVPAILQNNVFLENTAQVAGGAIYLYTVNAGIPVVLINNTISGNSSAIQGGGLYLNGSDADVINTIIWGNTAPVGASIYSSGSILEVRYSDVEGNEVWPGEGNVNCPATFLDDGYHLNNTCQLVEAGIASIEINGTLYECPAYDIDGEGRPSNAFPEIGADEVLIVSVPEPGPVNHSAFNIYPNPATGKITVELNGATTLKSGDVSIIGITGKELFHQQVAGPKTEINVSALPAGVYFIKLIPDDQNAAVKVGRFVKK
ncbi:MAG: T9SS type A sorting domain-containing protein [Lentimicrobium sp.]